MHCTQGNRQIHSPDGFNRFILFFLANCNAFHVIYCRIWPAVLRQATYGTIKFGTYYTLKKIITENGLLIDHNGNERVWCNVICAVTGKSHGA